MADEDAVWVPVLADMSRFGAMFDRGTRAATQRAGQQMRDDLGRGAEQAAKVAQAGIAKAEKAVDTATTRMVASRQRAEDAAGRQRVAEAQLQDLIARGVSEGARYVAAVEKAAAAQRAAETAERTRERTARQLATAHGRLEAAQRSAASATDETGDAARRAGQGMDEGAKGASRFTGQLTGMVKQAAGVGVALAGIGGAGAAMNKALENETSQAKLTAQLGATPEMAKEFGGIAGRLYSQAYGENLGDVNDALKNVWQQGLVPEDASTGQIEAVTAQVMNLSQAFDQDLGGATAAVGTMLKNGLAPDAEAAMDILTRGFQQGADKGGDLVDTMVEYPALFKSLGLSGQEAMGLISQGMAAGARSSDLVADALKEFQIRATDGSQASATAYEALGLNAEQMTAQMAKGGKEASAGLSTVLERLRGMQDPVERNAAAVGLFGTQAEDLAGALFALDPSTAVAGLGEVAGATDKVGETLGNTAQNKMEAFKRGLEQKITGVLGDNVLPMLGDFSSGLEENEGSLLATVAGMTGMTGVMTGFEQAKGVFDQVKDGVSSFKDGVVSAKDALTDAKKNITDAGSKLRSMASDAATNAKAAANTAAGWTKTAASAVVSAGRTSAAWVATQAKAVGSFIATAASATAQAAVTAGAWLGAQAKVAGGWLAAQIKAVGSFVAMGASAVAQGAVTAGAWVASSARTVGALAMQGAAFVAQKAVMVGGAVATGVMTAAQWALNSAMLANPITWIVVAIVGLIAVIVLIATKTTWFQTAWTATWNFVKAIFTGAWNGIKTAFEVVWNFIKDNWQTILMVITGPIGIAVGLVIKYWDQIKAGFAAAWEFIKNAAAAAVNWIVGKWNDFVLGLILIKDRVVTFMTQMWETIKGAAGAAKDWIVGKWDEFVGFITGLPGRVGSALSGIWDSLKNGFKEAINFIIDGWNNFRLDFSFTIPIVNKKISFVVDTPNIPRLADGGKAGVRDGKLWGPGTGRSDSILGMGLDGMPTALVSRDEFVMNAKSTRMFLPLLRLLNKGGAAAKSMLGRLPRFANGGVSREPYGLPVGSSISYGAEGFPAWVYEVGKRFGVQPSTYPGHQEKSGQNKGIDWSGSVANMQRFAEYLKGIAPELEQVIWMNPETGEQIGVADGQLVGPGTSQPGYYRDDWSGHTDHVHTRQSFAFGGDDSGPAKGIDDTTGSNTGALTTGQGEGSTGSGGSSGGFGAKVGGGVSSFGNSGGASKYNTKEEAEKAGVVPVWVENWPAATSGSVSGEESGSGALTSNTASPDGSGSGAGSTPGGAPDGSSAGGLTSTGDPTKDAVKKAFAEQNPAWSDGDMWAAVEWIVQKESGWQVGARNPSSGAFGLFQFLGSTKDAYLPDESMDPYTQGKAGAKYIAERYGDPLKAKAFWESHGWYDEGGLARNKGLLLKNVNQPERVLSPAQTKSFDKLVEWLTGVDLDAARESMAKTGDEAWKPADAGSWFDDPAAAGLDALFEVLTLDDVLSAEDVLPAKPESNQTSVRHGVGGTQNAAPVDNGQTPGGDAPQVVGTIVNGDVIVANYDEFRRRQEQDQKKALAKAGA